MLNNSMYKGIGMETKADNKVTSGRWRALPTWIVVTLLVIFFPVGLYVLWRQSRWSKRRKKTVTWALSSFVIAGIALIVIFAPPSVTVTSSLAPVKSDSYKLVGKITPSGSEVTVNGMQASVSGDTYTATVPAKEGDNSYKVVAVSAGKRTEQTYKLHRYTKFEVAAQDKAAAQKKAALASAKAKAADTAAKKKAAADAAKKKKIADAKAKANAAAKAKQQQAAAAKAKADAAASAKAARDKAAADAAAQAKAQAAAAAAVTVSQRNAVSKAKQYLNYTAFSHDGLVAQLKYEQFSAADATYGADHSGGDWNAQAAKKARQYMGFTSFSRGGLIDQLEYDKFTPDQAVYGVNSVGL